MEKLIATLKKSSQNYIQKNTYVFVNTCVTQNIQICIENYPHTFKHKADIYIQTCLEYIFYLIYMRVDKF